MARKKSSKIAKIAKAQRSLTFRLPPGTTYIDLAQSLSIVNRKLFRQGYVYGVESVSFEYADVNPATADVVRLEAFTAGDTWSVHNSHVKGHALWNEMNQLILDDNPSVQGKWADYKVFLDAAHRTAFFAGGQPVPVDGDDVPMLQGEWSYSRYVLPQHEVDPATGVPLPADETQAHILGANVGTAPNFLSVGLVQAYQESRATVFDDNPNVPAGFADSFFSLLTDQGSQEPELALVIQTEAEDPPYNLVNYPGSALNADQPLLAARGIASVGNPSGILEPFVAQCGLIKFRNNAFLNGAVVTGPTLTVTINLMAGKYKGVAGMKMGQ